MNKCLFCGQENDEDALFCYYCGKRISNTEEKPITAIEPNEQSFISNDNTFEMKDDVIKANSQKAKSQKSKKGLIITLSILATLIVIGVIGAVLINYGYLRLPGLTSEIGNDNYYDSVDDEYYDDIDEYDDSSENDNYEDEQNETENNEEYISDDENDSTENSIPDELYEYRDYLIEINKNYQVQLSYDDWNINIRSSPEFIDIEQSQNNIVGKMQSGTTVFVEYIYDNKWIVFDYDGNYAFASIYEKNDSSMGKLIFEID